MKSLIKLLLILIYFPFGHCAYSQTKQISGLIVDAKTGTCVANAHIINTNTKEGTISNSIGYFQISGIESDSLLITYISYIPIQIQIQDYINQVDDHILIESTSIEMDEIILRKGNWQQFKLEFVQTEFKAEQSSEIQLKGVLQYKGPPMGFQPSLFTAINNPISFVHHYMNKKARQKRKTSRYQQIIKKSSYIDD